jgi:hypothetical protein
MRGLRCLGWGFIGRVVAALPLLYAAWYWLFDYCTLPAVWLAGGVLEWLYPAVMESYKVVGHQVLFFAALPAAARGAGLDHFALQVDPLKYIMGCPSCLP